MKTSSDGHVDLNRAACIIIIGAIFILTLALAVNRLTSRPASATETKHLPSIMAEVDQRIAAIDHQLSGTQPLSAIKAQLPLPVVSSSAPAAEPAVEQTPVPAPALTFTETKLQVSGIVVDEHTRVAVINGEVREVGAILPDQIRIIAINRNSVRVTDRNGIIKDIPLIQRDQAREQ